MTARYRPEQVIPRALARAVGTVPYWFVIGGQAVRCFVPYRPSRDVDFGVKAPASLASLLRQLRASGWPYRIESWTNVQRRLRDGRRAASRALGPVRPDIAGPSGVGDRSSRTGSGELERAAARA